MVKTIKNKKLNNNTKNHYKQIFANPMKTYTKKEEEGIAKHLNKLKRDK